MGNIWLLAGVACLVSACGAPVVNLANLKVVNDGRAITFDREFRYDISRENDLPRPKPGMFRGLLKGTYTARYEDADGVYYANDSACVIYGTNLEQNFKSVSTGGVWIAKQPGATPFRLYWIAGRPGPIPVPLGAEPDCGTVAVPGAAATGAASGVDPVVTTAIVRANAPAGSPVAAGVGAGLGVGIVQGVEEYERGKIILMPTPAPGSSIAGAYRAVSR